MKPFMNNSFLIHTKTAEKLYFGYAEKLPIFDYHNHLSAKDIYENKVFPNISKMWLLEDHYKWRAMRTAGISEKYCRGNGSDWEKFEAWAKTVPGTLNNPLYHWTHLELKNIFGINTLLNLDTAEKIYDKCNSVIKKNKLSPWAILKKMNVKMLCTTDDPLTDLQYHKKLTKENKCPAKIFPTFRPEKALAFEDPAAFIRWIGKLSEITGIKVKDFNSYIDALESRHEAFHSAGCRVSDHSVEIPYAEEFNIPEVQGIFKKLISRKMIESSELCKLKTALMIKFGEWDSKRQWVMQLHIGPMRNTNSRLFVKLGPDSGFDSMSDLNIAKLLAKFLDMLDSKNHLPRTVIYNLNPVYDSVVASMLGNFNDGTVAGKMQAGIGWWYSDNKWGIERQIEVLSNISLLGSSIGFTTDSRSYLSFVRHEYFRRILCNMLGEKVEKGEIPKDMHLLGKMVQDICYNNAVKYFRLIRG